jgi:GGDEF domain-containing protein
MMPPLSTMWSSVFFRVARADEAGSAVLRQQVVIDPLAGMLNRNALSRRTEELERQSRVSGDP